MIATLHTQSEESLDDFDSSHDCNIVLAALRGRHTSEALSHFDDRFTFSDHALRLEFNDKPGLTEFFQKTFELLSDTLIRADRVVCCGDHVLIEWTLTTQQKGDGLGGQTWTRPRSARGASVVQVEGGKITRWSDYYDQIEAGREALAAYFSEWTEL